MKRPKIKMGEVDFILFGTILLLVTIGVIMVYSASSYIASFKLDNAEAYLWKQLLAAALGLIAMIFTLNIDYHVYKKYTRLLTIVTFIGLCLVFAFEPVNGAQRWIRLGPLSFQPSEIAKYLVVLFIAKKIDSSGEDIKTFSKGIMPNMAFATFFAGMVILEHNLSIASVIMFVAVAMLIIGGARWRYIFGMASSIAVAVVALIITQPYRMKRITGFLNPWADSQDTGYQLVQSLLALGSGGLTGVGIGNSRQKCFYIPEPHNDFILAVIGEELGYVGCIVILVLFMIFLWRGIRAALNAKDTYGALLAIGITAVVIIQCIINVAVVSGSMPVTGVPLPFISYGGTSISINMAFMGVLLNITRQNIKKKS